MKTTNIAATPAAVPKPPWNEQQAREVMEMCDRSGLSTVDFARKHGFLAHRIYTWRGRFRKRAMPRFVPVRVNSMATSSERHTVGYVEIMRAGFTIRVVGPVDAQQLRDVLNAVETMPC